MIDRGNQIKTLGSMNNRELFGYGTFWNVAARGGVTLIVTRLHR